MMLILARGNKSAAIYSAGHRGFTLLELLIVVALIGIASAVASLALRDPAHTYLEREAIRLSALLESVRADSRAMGASIIWLPRPRQTANAKLDFDFIGLPQHLAPPRQWLQAGVTAEVVGTTAAAPGLVLGPEPMIGPQRIILRLDDQQVALISDGLGPFMLESDANTVESESSN